MEKIMRYLLAALLLITLSAFQMVHAASPTAPLYIDDPNALVEQAKQYSGKTVVLEGEVVGDIMPRGQMYWINLLHKGLAMGVYITPLATGTAAVCRGL